VFRGGGIDAYSSASDKTYMLRESAIEFKGKKLSREDFCPLISRKELAVDVLDSNVCPTPKKVKNLRRAKGPGLNVIP